jgi:transcriptional regulator with XRE-family HTH domain
MKQSQSADPWDCFMDWYDVHSMKHQWQMQVRRAMAVDRDLLATYVRSRMDEEKLSLRKAADLMHSSPATLSRVLQGGQGEYVPDTATLEAIAEWLGMQLSDFEPDKRPAQSSLAEVSLHLHALPNLSAASARAIMDVVTRLYERESQRHTEKD